jgi:NitT/TauT family transport system ATP-binding protein
MSVVALPAPAEAPAGGAASDAVVLHEVTRRYGRTVALEDVTVRVRRGEMVSVVGASGCGKSTLLALIAGLDTPTSGSVHTPLGRPALMFQDATLFPWLTARRNVELALRLRGVGRAARHTEAQRLLELVHLGAHGDDRVHELSGGMRQRVSLARALAQGAQVLLMDEPFAALDAITRDVLHEELVSVHQQTGVTVVFVTHNVREAVRLGDRVVLLTSRPGRVAHEWQVDIPHPRRIESPRVGRLSIEITERLRQEISRHAH